MPAPKARAPETTPPPPPIRAPDPLGPFDLEATLKYWNDTVEPLQLTFIHAFPLERKPDLVEFSANGEILYIVFYKEAKHLLYGTKDGNLIETIEYGTAPLTAAAITPNGKHLVATLGDQGTGVYDVAAKKEVFVHADIKNVNFLQTTTGKNTFILGSQPSGEIYRYRLLHEFGAAFPKPRSAPAEFDADSRIELASSADGRFLQVNWPFKRDTISVFEFSDDGRMKEQFDLGLAAPMRSPIGVGQRMSHYLAGNEVGWNHTTGKTFARTVWLPYTGRTPPQCFVAPSDTYSALYEPERGQLTIHHVASSYYQRHRFDPKQKPDLVRLNWERELFTSCDAGGRVVLARLRGYQHRNEKILRDLRKWLENKQDDRIGKVAAAFERDLTFFSGSSPEDTKYECFHSLLRNGGKLFYPATGDPHWRGWLERNPDSRLARTFRLKKLVEDAWEARGGGFADTVTPEGWKIFHDKLGEAESIVDTFVKEPTIPPAAYPKIFAISMGQQWDAVRTRTFVDRMLKECPDNYAGHNAYATSLLPRWGGELEDCKEYAERVAREVPGPTGEAAYSSIAITLHPYHLYEVFGELGFDRERAQAGVKQLYRDHLDSAHYRQAELIMAALSRNKAGTRQWFSEIIKHHDGWAQGVIEEKTFEAILSQLNK
jgi:hypothetical protein